MLLWVIDSNLNVMSRLIELKLLRLLYGHLEYTSSLGRELDDVVLLMVDGVNIG